ncbi:MAG: hypothetical protein Q4E22_05475 [Coriobacteriia bacterium]|nr:hypothetical protein [Coriobacteriia bacterium]
MALSLVFVPNSYARLELPYEEQLKLYPRFPTEAVGTTDAAKEQKAHTPQDFVLPTPSVEPTADALPATLGDLMGASKRLDNKIVVFSGEVVGDVLNGPKGFKWILLDDSTGSISVLIRNDHAKLIKNLGDYNTIGTKLQVTGVYHINDVDQFGEMDVRAYEVSVIEEGGPNRDSLNIVNIILGVGLLALACALLLIYRNLKKKAVE